MRTAIFIPLTGADRTNARLAGGLGLPLAGPQQPADHAAMMGMATQAEVNTLQRLPVIAAEVSFLQLMIRHHQGGVAMAEAALRGTRCAEVVRLARAIVQSQQNEIEYMQQLLEQSSARRLPTHQMTPAGH